MPIIQLGLRYKKYLSFGIILIGALVFRFNHLENQALWFDEAWTWAATKLSVAELWELSQFDPHPPLYYLILKGWVFILPDTEIALRSLSVVFSMASLAAIMTAGTWWWGTKAGLCAGLLFSLSSFDVYYSQEARMYTLLALLWLLSYIAFIQIISGQRRFVFLWGIFNIGMAWTHFYGILAVALHIACATGLLVIQKLGNKHPSVDQRLIITTVAGILLAISPILFLLWNFRNASPGGAWVPSSQDLLSLFSLWTAGLSSARVYFLDSGNLVFPILENVSTSIWLIAGILLFGVMTIWGFVTTWRSSTTHRSWVIISIILLILPILTVYGYAKLTQSRLWAFKPTLGAAYLVYLWAGAGLGAVTAPWTRRVVLLGVGLLAIASLGPYYSSWQKSDADSALSSLPTTTKNPLILIQPGYIAPLADFYLDPGTPLWGFSTTQELTDSLLPLFKGQDLLQRPQPVSCAEISRKAVKDIVIYGTALDILQDPQFRWPSCLKNKDLWVYRKTGWELLKPK